MRTLISYLFSILVILFLTQWILAIGPGIAAELQRIVHTVPALPEFIPPFVPAEPSAPQPEPTFVDPFPSPDPTPTPEPTPTEEPQPTPEPTLDPEPTPAP